MDILYLLTGILFFLWTTRNILYWVTLWQKEDYHNGSVLVALLREIRQNIFSLVLSILAWILFVVYFLLILSDNRSGWVEYVILLYFLIRTGEIIYETVKRKFKLPHVSLRALSAAGFSVIVLVILFQFPLLERYLWLLLLERSVMFLVFVISFLISVPVELYEDMRIRRARHKLMKKHIKCIVIVGTEEARIIKNDLAIVLGASALPIPHHGNTPADIAGALIHCYMQEGQYVICDLSPQTTSDLSHLLQVLEPEIIIFSSLPVHHTKNMVRFVKHRREYEEIFAVLPPQSLRLFNIGDMYIASLVPKRRSKHIVLYSNGNVPRNSRHRLFIALERKKFKKYLKIFVYNNYSIDQFIIPSNREKNITTLLPIYYLSGKIGVSKDDIFLKLLKTKKNVKQSKTV